MLVDQTDERCSLYFDRSSAKRFAQSSRMLPALARLRLYGPLASGPGRVQPADVAADHRAEDFTQRAAATSAAEMADLLQDLARLREEPLDLHGIPVIVISGTKASALDRTQRTALTASHRATAEALGARFVEAPHSGHLVMFSEPQLVIDQIVRLLDSAERG